MYNQKLLHRLVEDELNRCEHLYRKLNVEQKFLPEGSLVTDNNGGIYRSVRVGGKQYKIILKSSERDLQGKLKKRRYVTESLKKLNQRIKLCEEFLNNDILYDPKTIESQLPKQYRGLGNIDIFLSGDVNEEAWMSAVYRINPMGISRPHYTPSGLCTRSKSEAMIATRLEERKIPFRYEAELCLDDKSVYPDFTVLNRRKRRVIYLEHLGMIDDERYIFHNLKKLEQYSEHGIVLGDNLFITYESLRSPLGIKTIDEKLDEMLN